MSIFNRQYTIGDLMNIDQGRQERAGQCTVELIKTYHVLKEESLLEKFKKFFLDPDKVIKTYNVIFKFEVTSGKGSKHKVFIKTSPDFNLNAWQNNKVQVYCDCPDFKYRSAYELNKHNSVFLNNSTSVKLGQALTDKPKEGHQTTLLCKHLFAAVQWLINNYANIMKTM